MFSLDILVLLNHLNKIPRNQYVFVSCSEISISVIDKHMQDVGNIRTFCLPGGTCSVFYLGGQYPGRQYDHMTHCDATSCLYCQIVSHPMRNFPLFILSKTASYPMQINLNKKSKIQGRSRQEHALYQIKYCNEQYNVYKFLIYQILKYQTSTRF